VWEQRERIVFTNVESKHSLNKEIMTEQEANKIRKDILKAAGNGVLYSVSESSWTYYEKELDKIEQLNQAQSSLHKQMFILRQFANKLGLYDVADYLKR
jgi:hypothetical protein